MSKKGDFSDKVLLDRKRNPAKKEVEYPVKPTEISSVTDWIDFLSKREGVPPPKIKWEKCDIPAFWKLENIEYDMSDKSIVVDPIYKQKFSIKLAVALTHDFFHYLQHLDLEKAGLDFEKEYEGFFPYEAEADAYTEDLIKEIFDLTMDEILWMK